MDPALARGPGTRRAALATRHHFQMKAIPREGRIFVSWAFTAGVVPCNTLHVIFNSFFVINYNYKVLQVLH